MSSLYELNKAIALYEMEFDSDGVWVNEDELDELNLAKDEKIEQLALWVKNLRADIEAFKREEANLKERRNALEKKADNVEDYIALNLDGKKFETTRVKIQWRKTESVVIDDDRLVPDELCENTIIRKPNKKIIKARLKQAEANDETVTWARLDRRNKMKII